MRNWILALAGMLSLAASTPAAAQGRAATAPAAGWSALGPGPCGIVDGQAYCLDPLGPFPFRRIVGQRVVTVQGGEDVVCGVTPDGAGVCGDATSSARGRHALDGVRFIAGTYYSGAWCASLERGGVRCGAIEMPFDDAVAPTSPTGLPDTLRFVEAFGGLASCARAEGGEIWCWGHARAGELGRGDTRDSAAAPIAGGLRYRLLTTGDRAWCGIVVDGSVRCWGDGRVSVFGDQTLDECMTGSGDPFPCAKTPRAIALPGPARLLAVSASGWCAVLDDGRLVCWGSRFNRPVAEVAGVPADIVEIGVGGSYGCARTGGGELWCWSLTGIERSPARLAPPNPGER